MVAVQRTAVSATAYVLPASCLHWNPYITSDSLCMSGMIGLDPATRALVAGGPYAEAKQARPTSAPTPRAFLPVFLTLKQILTLLCAALPDWGLTLEHLVGTPGCDS